MKWKMPVFSAVCLILSMLSPGAVSAAEDGSDLTFVYIHGFNGAKPKPAFCEFLREFLTDNGVSSKVINHEWDSVRIDPAHAQACWIQAEKNADAEAAKFKRVIIDRLEAKGDPWVLVGFSIGSRVVLRALEQTENQLKHLQAIYFLGSAMPRDTTMRSRAALPDGLNIISYHSPVCDLALQTAFEFMYEIPAGGRFGFEDDDVFVNLPVSCTHVHAGVGAHTDYSVLAEPIGAMELFRQGVFIGGSMKPNQETAVLESGILWNSVLRLTTEAGTEVEIEQHNLRNEYYRALRLEPNGERRRFARGESLQAILDEIGAESHLKSR
ncbi:MAG: pimeloyl-ACP methyl ester carboxylesterase [Verrucomicrobiales bacterium]|jgi:pimeloyl-ACP methyl ester carboxylesterase